MLYNRELPDGVYNIKNRYGNYLVCKKYRDEYKERICFSIEDCGDQVAEWDEIYRSKGKLDYASLAALTNYQVGRGRCAHNLYYIYVAGTNRLVFHGSAAACACRMESSISRIYKCVDQPLLLNKKYDVVSVLRGKDYTPVEFAEDYEIAQNDKFKYSKGVRHDMSSNKWIAYVNQGKKCLFRAFDDMRMATIYYRDILSCVSGDAT